MQLVATILIHSSSTSPESEGLFAQDLLVGIAEGRSNNLINKPFVATAPARLAAFACFCGSAEGFKVQSLALLSSALFVPAVRHLLLDPRLGTPQQGEWNNDCRNLIFLRNL